MTRLNQFLSNNDPKIINTLNETNMGKTLYLKLCLRVLKHIQQSFIQRKKTSQ